MGVKPEDVKDVCICIGGDHRKEVFQLTFKVVIRLIPGVIYERLCEQAGWVSGKDTTEVLEESIMPWLIEDLETIHKASIVLEELDDRTIGSVLLEAGSEMRDGIF